ncbi:tyrosine-type recombinase/integrase [Parvicella tangerina]|uniref:Tyr recombinase domain-containing protein n=1 Tax=Parvicella tangerina TaxID=2829795 RepID=A0A916NDH9_9FLAO|nr:tyrosine-type recombinase/integrase [Parvicella tangerina]CAG5086745.1 hypothetical protein CRYO30217_03263 [Parvicella tangerina]
MKALKIPKTKGVPGLFTYCTKCKKRTGNGVCGLSKKPIDACPNKNSHVFKVSFKIPMTNSVRTRNLETRNLREASKQAYEFREELEANNYNIPEDNIQKGVQYDILVDTMSMYIDFLNNIGVPEHLQKNRSKAHINEVVRIFKRFTRVLSYSGYNLELFKVFQINQDIIGKYHDYLLNVEKYSNKTYNKHISGMRQFINWLIERKGYDIKNPFIEVIALPTSQRNETITKEEFEKLVSVITPENSRDMRVKYYKYYYKEWLASAFKLALYTGLRREEFLSLRWSSIEYDEHRRPILIKVPNFKVIRLVDGKRTESSRIKWVPIIPELLNLLMNELEMDNYKDTDKYLIANNESRDRDRLPLFMSRAFGHFWHLTGIKKELQLNDLRNTYITELFKKFGDKAAVITDHADISTVKKHYTKSSLISEAAIEFRVFE